MSSRQAKRKGMRNTKKHGTKGSTHRKQGSLPQQTSHSSSYRKEMSNSEEVTDLTESFDGQLVSAGIGGIAEHFYLDSALNTAPGLGCVIQGAIRQQTAFNYYRVVKAKVTHKLYNMEAFPVEWIIMFTNLDPGTSFGTYKLLKGNPLVYNRVLGAKGSGQDRQNFSKTIILSEILGSNNVETADSFRAVISADPADFLWYGHAAIAMGGNTLTATNGVIYQRRVTRTIRWYSRAEQNAFVTEVDGVIMERFKTQLPLLDKEDGKILTESGDKRPVIQKDTRCMPIYEKYDATYLHQLLQHYTLNSLFYENATDIVRQLKLQMLAKGGVVESARLKY